MKVVLLQSSYEHDIKSRTQADVSRKWNFAPCRAFGSRAPLHTQKARIAGFTIGRAKTMTELLSTRVRQTRRSRTLRCSSFGVFLQITQSFSPQPLAKKICFAKIFCDEEERAFSACCPALPYSRTIRSVPTSLCKKICMNKLLNLKRKEGCLPLRAPI